MRGFIATDQHTDAHTLHEHAQPQRLVASCLALLGPCPSCRVCIYFSHASIRYYVDGEVNASVNLPFGLAHGSNMADDDGPWSAGAQFGKTGQPSGIWNTHKVPFQRCVPRTGPPLLSGALRMLLATLMNVTRNWPLSRIHTEAALGAGTAVGSSGRARDPPSLASLASSSLAFLGGLSRARSLSLPALGAPHALCLPLVHPLADP